MPTPTTSTSPPTASSKRRSSRSSVANSPDGAIAASGLTPRDLTAIFDVMLQTREFDEAINRLYQQGKIVGGAYSGRGNEATSVGSAYALGPDDYIFPMHRDLGAHIARGASVEALMLQYLGREGGLSRGTDGVGHYADPSKRIYGNISHLGAMVPVAVGVALACKMRKQPRVTMTYIGDGGSNVGEVHEGLAMASVMRLPFVLVIENNQYAYSTPVSKQSIAARLSDRAAGYGIPGVTVDGTDILALYGACKTAVARARKGEGPSIVESVTMRMEGHAAHDTAWYVPKKLLEEWGKKDPLARLEALLLAGGILTAPKLRAMAERAKKLVDGALTRALDAPYPPGEAAVRGVYAPAGER